MLPIPLAPGREDPQFPQKLIPQMALPLGTLSLILGPRGLEPEGLGQRPGTSPGQRVCVKEDNPKATVEVGQLYLQILIHFPRRPSPSP